MLYKMKVYELSHEQCAIIAATNPKWIAFYRPEWMAINHREWMIENHKDWIDANCLDADVPIDILK